MILRRLSMIAALALFCLPAGMIAGGGKTATGWEGRWLTRECVGDDLVYYLNIGLGSSYIAQKILTIPGYCKCKKASGQVVTEAVNPHQSGFCHCSTNLSGGPEPNANTQIAVAAPGAGGSSGPLPALRHASPTGAAAFTPSVPYRPFPLPDYFSASSTPTAPMVACEGSVNPTAFLVYHLDSDVVRTNLCTGATVATVLVTSNPLQVQVTPDGKWGIVTSYDNAISFIDTDTNMVANTILTDQDTFPSGLSISPDGSFALVTSYINDNPALLVIDPQTQTLTSRFPLDRPYPQSVFLNPDATLAWVTYPFDNVVEVVDVMTGIVDFAIPVQEPLDVVFNPTGTVAYISSREPGSVLAVNTTTYQPLANIATAAGSSDLLLSPDGAYLTVNNFDDNSISVIDTSSLTALSTTPVSDTPIGAVLVPIQ